MPEFAIGAANVVDLTLPISEAHPSWWPTCQPFRHKVDNYFANVEGPSGVRSRGPFLTNIVIMDEHTGTHVDAPAHFIPPQGSGYEHAGPAGALTLDKIPISQTMGPLAIIDVRDLTAEVPGVSPAISRERVDRWESMNRGILPGDVVVFRTGWDTFYKPGADGSRYVEDVVSGRTPGWPAPDGECVRALTDRGVRCIGTDAPSMGAAHDGVTAHVEGLSRGAVFVECLAHLDRLPAQGAQFIFLPIRIVGASGAPGRAIALVEAG